jgi:hypothetical protein
MTKRGLRGKDRPWAEPSQDMCEGVRSEGWRGGMGGPKGKIFRLNRENAGTRVKTKNWRRSCQVF